MQRLASAPRAPPARFLVQTLRLLIQILLPATPGRVMPPLVAALVVVVVHVVVVALEATVGPTFVSAPASGPCGVGVAGATTVQRAAQEVDLPMRRSASGRRRCVWCRGGGDLESTLEPASSAATGLMCPTHTRVAARLVTTQTSDPPPRNQPPGKARQALGSTLRACDSRQARTRNQEQEQQKIDKRNTKTYRNANQMVALAE